VTKLPHRRQFLHLAAGAAALPTVSSIGWAQAYPTRPVRIIVGFAAGGGQDIAARLIGQWLSENLGQSFIIENRTGANGNFATEAVVRSPPDGHTLLLFSGSATVNETLYDKLNFSLIRDIAPVAGLMRFPYVMEVHPSVPANTVPEFIAYAKANPGKINFASSGNGNLTQLSTNLLKIMTGINIVDVPYRGSGASLTDVLGGQVQGQFDGLLSSIEYIRAGKLRALAVTTATRSPALPDLPTVGEFVPGYEVSGWFGIGAPKNTSAEIIDKLNKSINAAQHDPKIKARLTDLAGTILPGSPADFGKLIADETEKWAKVIRTANIRPE
jgi:tripartite-type tricarboxylate transporter receptor subunit TctC